MIDYIAKHPIRMGIASILIAFLLKIILGLLLSPFVHGAPAPQRNSDSILLIWLISLPLETLVGQALPYFVLRRMGVTSTATVVVSSTIFFSALHLGYGPVIAIILLGPSLVFAVLWFAYRKTSFMYALVGVTVVHYAHNVIALLLR